MSRNQIYIAAFIFILVLMIAVVGFATYLNKKTSPQNSNSTKNIGASYSSPTLNSSANTFGKIIQNIDKEKQEEQKAIEEATAPFKAKLNQIYSEPVVFMKNINDTTNPENIIFTEALTGNVFTLLFSGETLKIKRILSTTAPGIKESLSADGGKVVIRRYADENGVINSVIGSTTLTNQKKSLTSRYLPNKIESISVSRDGQKLFFIIPEESGAVGYLSDVNSTTTTPIWSSYIKGWHTKWIDNENILLNEKPTAKFGSSAFIINTKTGDENIFLSQKPGLSIKMASTTTALFSISNNNSIKLFYINNGVQTKTPLSTFAEKCAILNTEAYCFVPKSIPSGEYPDDWYMGNSSFSDELWKLDLNSMKTTLVLSPETEYNEILDVDDVFTTPDKRFLIFRNKKDQTLWSIQIKDYEKTNK